jgi:hypothetical protein
MTELAEVPPPPPLFFLSYARSGSGAAKIPKHEMHQQVLRFFEDLSENVAGLTAWPPGADPGFMDQNIRAGTHWSRALLHALGTCQVFVALLSGSYTTSEWCGMEWDGFSRRKVTGTTGNNPPSAIIPVVWAPYPDNRMPRAISGAQRFSPAAAPNANILGNYVEYGISGLLWTKQEDSYRVIVWQLARHIANFCHNYTVEPRTLRKDRLRNIFQENLP